MVVPTNQATKVLLIWKFDEHKNKFSKGWSPGYNILKGKEKSDTPIIETDLYNPPLIKYDIY